MSASSESMPTPSSRTASPPSAARASLLSWLGVAPFLLFALLFLILPTGMLMVGAFHDAQGHFTLNNIARLFDDNILSAYKISLEISAASAILGTALGLLLALAAIRGGLPAWIRPTLTTFSGVASNFAGIPLAFAFLSTLGRMGLVTMLLRKYLDFDLYASGFSILSFAGLTLTYLYFQVPLMVLIIAPAVEGLKDEWREACESLGGSGFAYWRHIALPVLWPSMVGAALLLFANAFGAVATAYALTGSSLNIVTILLYAQIHGDVLHDQNLGYALALGMVLITGSANAGYIWLRKRSHREAA
ncbi:ABC transporter permease subunit [Chromobacterium vaccinii]|nr:ABC transporter permease subunit [Chromobacterium vaccinii]